MEYSLESVYDYILELTDKKGSDFFQLPFVLNVFKSCTDDFLGERIAIFENTQKVTEDIVDLVKTTKVTVVEDMDNPFIVLAPVPELSLHLFSAKPVFKNGVIPRKTRLIRHGQDEPSEADPHNRPTVKYPTIIQETNVLKINSGKNERALSCYITFLKKPLFAPLDDQDQKIVDLQGPTIEALIKKTVFELESSKADDRSQMAYSKAENFRNPMQ